MRIVQGRDNIFVTTTKLCIYYVIQEDLFYPHSTVQNLLWDGLQHFAEPVFKYWPFNKIRERALKWTIELIRHSAEESRYTTMACVEKVS